MTSYVLLSVLVAQIGTRILFPFIFEVFSPSIIVFSNQVTLVSYYFVLSIVSLCSAAIVASGLVVSMATPTLSTKIVSVTYFLMTFVYVAMAIDASVNLQENYWLNQIHDVLFGNSRSHVPLGVFDLMMFFCVIICLYPKKPARIA